MAEGRIQENAQVAVNARKLVVSSLLPYVELTEIPPGSSFQLRETGGKTTILVTLHSAECAGCREYLSGLVSLSREFDLWDGRLLVILPGPVPAGRTPLPPMGKVLFDEHGSIADPACAAVFVADRYAQIFAAVRGGVSHDLPSARELAEWLKYLGTLCPE